MALTLSLCRTVPYRTLPPTRAAPVLYIPL